SAGAEGTSGPRERSFRHRTGLAIILATPSAFGATGGDMSSIWKLFGKQDATTAEAVAGEGAEPRIEPPPGAEGAEGQPPALASVKPPGERPVLPPRGRYGIDDAIRLMRTLPVDDNVDLVVRVIKRTLESLSVRVPEIIEDAQRRQEALRTGISEHQAAIQQLEREIETRRAEIAHLETELAETTTVRERLQLAENLQASVPPKIAPTPHAPTAMKRPEPPP